MSVENNKENEQINFNFFTMFFIIFTTKNKYVVKKKTLFEIKFLIISFVLNFEC